MRILFDGRVLHDKPSGVRDVAEGLVRGLSEASSYTSEKIDIACTTQDCGSGHLVLNSRGFMHYGLPVQAKKLGASIVIPRQTRPIIFARHAYSIFHDIGFLARPELYPSHLVRDLTTKLSLRSDAKYFAVSQFTVDEIQATGLGSNGVALPLGAMHSLAWRPADDRYILCVAAHEAQKNLVRLVEVWNRIAADGTRLVICGRQGNETSALRRAVALSRPNTVELVSGLGALEYAELFERCWGYIQPSLYEGLGIPALDALAAGIPCAVGQASEAGRLLTAVSERNAGQVFDALDLEQMEESLADLLNDNAVRTNWSQSGRETVPYTDWAKAAGMILQEVRE